MRAVLSVLVALLTASSLGAIYVDSLNASVERNVDDGTVDIDLPVRPTTSATLTASPTYSSVIVPSIGVVEPETETVTVTPAPVSRETSTRTVTQTATVTAAPSTSRETITETETRIETRTVTLAPTTVTVTETPEILP